MRLEVVSRLPAGSKVLLEVPLHLRALAGGRGPKASDSKRNRIRLTANPHGKVSFGPVLLGAKLRAEARLLVTWRLVPKGKLR